MSRGQAQVGQESPAVLVEQDGPVAVLQLARPHKANAMDAEIADALLDTLQRLGDGPTRALVVTGQGRWFSAGGDVETIRAMRDDPQQRQRVLEAHQELFWAMTRLTFPTVAAVNGAAVGAGATLAVMCDLVVMAEDGYLCDPRVSLGLLDGAGGFVLWPVLTSLSAAKEYLLLGERLSGAQAYRLGVANRVVPAAEVLGTAVALARRLASMPQHAVSHARRLLNSSISGAANLLEDSARAEQACFDTAEHHELLEELIKRMSAPAAGDTQ